MNDTYIYQVCPTTRFNKDMEYYIKKRKFKHLSTDIKEVLEKLQKGIFNGDALKDLTIDTNNKVYKVRMANKDTNYGKSNGYRIIYFVEDENKLVYLITIYYKKDDIKIPTNKEIYNIIKKYCINK